MTDEMIDLLKQCVEKVGVAGVARAFTVARPTVTRWLTGATQPHPAMHGLMLKKFRQILNCSGVV